MRKIIKVLLLLQLAALLLTFTGCMSMLIESAASSVPAPNRIFIHDNPEVGDYSIIQGYGNLSKQSNVTRDKTTKFISIAEYEVLDVQGNIITIEQLGSGYEEGKDPSKATIITYRYLVDRAGFVQEAYLVNRKGDLVPLSILQPDMEGYIDFNKDELELVSIENELIGEMECYVYTTVMDLQKQMNEMGYGTVAKMSDTAGYTVIHYLVSKSMDKPNFRLVAILSESRSVMMDTSSDFDYNYYGTQENSTTRTLYLTEQGKR
ncbi:MAG: hypothetical protein PF693_13190 [Spirochaetia bacterium]|jgi:hypothetical protein|nr:hypothetical protein [Spirochaetia bacterium]